MNVFLSVKLIFMKIQKFLCLISNYMLVAIFFFLSILYNFLDTSIKKIFFVNSIFFFPHLNIIKLL